MPWYIAARKNLKFVFAENKLRIGWDECYLCSFVEFSIPAFPSVIEAFRRQKVEGWKTRMPAKKFRF
jgi:hypothetical protein